MANASRPLVVLDPGHGGHDPGAVGASGTTEKAIVLAIALAAAQHLERRGVEVVLTRRRDAYPSLHERTQLANKLGAAAFISIHCNAAENRQASGIETFHFPGARAGEDLAHAVQGHLLAAFPGRRDRGVKTGTFHVLRHTAMPAVLVECEFISHAETETWLRHADTQERIARALSAAVVDWLDHKGFLAPLPGATAPSPTCA